MKFEEYNFTEDVMKGITAAQYTECMPVQENVFQRSLTGSNVAVQSQTGSGKTAAFLLTILNAFALNRDKKRIKSIIIVPTRELAVQIQDDAELLSIGMDDIRIGCFYGGVGYPKQEKMLKDGVDIVIGTPGRLLDFQKSNKIDYRMFDIAVIDEADRMFDMGFYPDIRQMMSRMRPAKERQTMLFSATLNNRARNLAWEFMHEPVEIEIESENITVEEIRQELYHVSKNEKFDLLLFLLKKYNPDNAIIFTNTKIRVVEIAKRLKINGYNVQFLMGDLPQNKRLQVIERMKAGEIKFLVATDVAARGLHVDDLQLVINYDIPEDFENYVHRIGRTARAGKSGLAITMACEQFVYGLEAIQDFISMQIPVAWVDDEELESVKDKSAGLHFRDLVEDADFAGASRNKARNPQRGGGSAPRNNNHNRNHNTTSGGGRQSSVRGPRSTENRSQSGSNSKSTPERRTPSVQAQKRSGVPNTSREQGYGQKKTQHIGPGSNTRNNPSSGKPNNPQKRHKPVDYNAIESLSFDERMEYYKKQYSSHTHTTDKKSTHARRQKPSTSVKASLNTSAGKEVDSVKTQKTNEEKKGVKGKAGFFAKLLQKL
ncbi:MAG: DEAD/DEAH box helicase [Bacteroidetes bacterium]|nr:DEAD/DEAH box helicase [Bacteroidota bacterium]